jgi:hypothetical protein
MKKPNTNRVVVGSDKGLTDLQEKINFLKSKGILKGYEEQGGIRGAAIPIAPLGRVYYQVMVKTKLSKRIKEQIKRFIKI